MNQHRLILGTIGALMLATFVALLLSGCVSYYPQGYDDLYINHETAVGISNIIAPCGFYN